MFVVRCFIHTLFGSVPTSPCQVKVIAVSTGNCPFGVSKISLLIFTRGSLITVGKAKTQIKQFTIKCVYSLCQCQHLIPVEY